VRVLKDVEVTIEGKTSRLRALFNSGSSFTIMGYEILWERFGEVRVRRLPEVIEAFF